ncbi:CRISPR-associated protein Csb2 [Geodermatophilus africanus]|uniref:CRISPR-associated protein Csb2 n=1 Tax=Geodermatophilus africanus TaxID=1137993 RepID=A0A1H3G4Q0_9ACTN|nr:type I-U CRISPR-associated protein Csb2 [Geodermatophilus africanus]SDX98302.1 CRISPR-associated protein Csb2 [Geodermatophilus africanus]
MREFAVIAELPLGAYRARTPGGHLDPVPSPARLHAALLCAAATGTRAMTDGDELRPNDDDLETLKWLEQHPPDGVAVPNTAQVRTTVYGYRREGTLVKEGGRGPKDKVVPRDVVGLIAVDGAFAWTWADRPSPAIQESLDALCRDVAHLGTADTPVRMRVGTAYPTHRRDPNADLFMTEKGLDVDIAADGRTEALIDAFAARRSTPRIAADRFSTSEVPRSTTYIDAGRQAARFVSLSRAEEPEGPWSTVLLAGFGGTQDRVRPADHVGWAIAVHRALIAIVGDGAPAVLTGTYLPGVPRPANRVAIQILTPNAVRAAGIAHQGAVLAVLLPTGADSTDLATVSEAFGRLPYVTWGRAVRTLTPLRARSARTFWLDGPAGRRFDVRPAAVPDTRPLGRDWTIADAVALSFGFVLRDRAELVGQGRGDTRHRETARRVQAAGLKVYSVQRVMDGDLSRYAHRIDPTRVIQPYRAQLSLGGLLNERSLVCIGQSRHLGGGLLAPSMDGSDSGW